MSSQVHRILASNARRGRGTIIATVLLFLALVLPVTLILLNTIQIETLLPANENLRLLALHEADKGFDAAINLILQDNDEGTWIESTVPDPLNPGNFLDIPLPAIANPAVELPDVPVVGGFFGGFIPYTAYRLDLVTDDDKTYFQIFQNRGEHELDYLSESWARHPDNDQYYLASRSVENRQVPANKDDTGNLPSGDPVDYTVPERWILPNVPIGMDDFSEATIREDRKVLDTGFEMAPGVGGTFGPSDPLPIDKAVPTSGGSAGQPEGLPLDDGSNWALSPADKDYDTNADRASMAPRPASFFRNNDGRETTIEDTMTYDAADDGVGPGDTNQYLDYPPLQQLVRAANWANTFFGGGTNIGSSYEYKPAPGAITRYQVGGSSGSEALPGWYESIISDESGRFPINGLLNIIFQGGNLVYGDVDVPTDTGNITINASTADPQIAPDHWDTKANATDLMFDTAHANHYNFLLARDMLASLFLTDEDVRNMDRGGAGVINTEMERAQGKANYIIREMLLRRAELDRSYDGNGSGAGDTSTLTYKDGTQLLNETYDGNGRLGDGQDPKQGGTWQVFRDPLDILKDFESAGLFSSLTFQGSNNQPFLRPTLEEFSRLHQLATVYTYDTEYTADPEQSADVFQYPGIATRWDFNTISENDLGLFPNSPMVTSGMELLISQLGYQRALSLLRWRDGQVDLNLDGSLDDEYVLQPVANFSAPEGGDGDATLPHTQITYRERNHPNFQDPAAAGAQMYHAYLNIPDIGTLLTVPMNVAPDLLLGTNLRPDGTSRLQLLDTAVVNATDLPATIGTTDGALSADIEPKRGQALFFEQDGDIAFVDVPNGITKTAAPGAFTGTHPSFAPGAVPAVPGATRPYIFEQITPDPGELWIADAANGALIQQIPDPAALGLPTLTLAAFPGAPTLQLSGPDWNPRLSDDVAFALGTGITITGDCASGGIQAAGDIYEYNLSFPLPAPLPLTTFRTNGSEGGYWPDYNPKFDQIAFCHVDTTDCAQPFQISVINLANRAVTDLNLRAEFVAGGFFPGIPPANNFYPLMPAFSPSGETIAFAALEVDDATGLITDADIWAVDYDPDGIALIPGTLRNLTNTDGEFELYPIFGEGLASIATQGDSISGNSRGQRVICASCPLPPYDPTDKALMATYLSGASLATRVNVPVGDPLNPTAKQNWRMRDLPVVPAFTTEAISALADQLTFREPRSAADGFRLQAYPGRININTAPRQVLRAIFLSMFQGSQPTLDTSGLGRPASNTPRVDAGLFSDYLILPIPGTNNQRRFDALKIADQYAHQVVQYRKWLYNNIFLITEEQVPNGQWDVLGIEPNGPSGGPNYRANPNIPYDQDMSNRTVERSLFDPAPPYRNIGDLFKVALYFNYANVTGGPSTDTDGRIFEGIQSPGGPDWDAMPIAGASRSDRSVATWTWGPIYRTDTTATYNGENAPGDPGSDVLPPYDIPIDLTRDADQNFDSQFALQQRYRLFSADDFKWVAPYLTTRSYMYRVESRGVIRVQANQEYGAKVDITADKFWIINTGDEAVQNYAIDGGDYDAAFPIHTSVQGLSQDILDQTLGSPDFSPRPRNFTVVAYQEQPESGVSLTRRRFVPNF